MTDEICSWLSYQNKKFVRLNESQQITKVYFDFENDIYKISINDVEYELSNFKSVFYRNGGIYYNITTKEIDNNLLEFYNSELKSITGFIYHYLKINGTNIFGNLFTKEVNKLEVLLLAKSLGLKIPDTYILSQRRDISKIDFTQQYITKSVSEIKPIFVENELYLNYTHEINISHIQDRKENIIPSLIQKRVNKIYEIRTFFFEKRIWAIGTFDFSDNIDIRNIKDSEKKYLPCKLPIDIQRKIHKMAKIMDLKCGTIDLIKSSNEYYFLEVNPLGQFHQVSYYGNYQIEKYIADLL
ncbi:hypothetical protein GCM10022217_18690 [Chryseobacterium ginsenosidimutans]|uniref:hypothetical protein n=1 Tax=Chryseobacterium ginsenosidimutans TaxID=687846 RepID=UPI0031DD537A